MQDVNLENQLIIVDIADAMLDYVSMQSDIDDTKIKAASIVAQKIDIKRIIGQANVERCINPESDADKALRELVVPALCYFTYSRALKMFQGTFTNSGYTVDTEATDKNISKSVGNEHSSIAEAFMVDVVEFLEAENEGSADENVKPEKINPRIRTFGGREARASN